MGKNRYKLHGCFKTKRTFEANTAYGQLSVASHWVVLRLLAGFDFRNINQRTNIWLQGIESLPVEGLVEFVGGFLGGISKDVIKKLLAGFHLIKHAKHRKSHLTSKPQQRHVLIGRAVLNDAHHLQFTVAWRREVQQVGGLDFGGDANHAWNWAKHI